MNIKMLIARKLFMVMLIFTVLIQAVLAAEVNIYSERKEELIKPLLKKFTEKTGIKVNIITGGGDILIKRLQIEGRNSPADVLLTTDVARLYRARQSGLLQAVHSETLDSAIPETFRDSEGYWYGLSLRSRVIVYAMERVNPEQLSTYEALADPQWKNRICVRSSANAYNQSLVASLIAHNGMEQTEQWVRGLVANLARSPRGGDRDQIKAVAIGECDIALVNTYYLGGMLHSELEAEREAAQQVGLFWPNQDGRGAHFNVSGAGVTASASHKMEAVRLIEFLTEDDSQFWYAEQNYEFPVKNGITPGETLQKWGNYQADTIKLEILGQNNDEAVKLMDRAGWK